MPVSPDVAAVTADGISVCGRDLSAARRFYPHLFPGEGQVYVSHAAQRGTAGQSTISEYSAAPIQRGGKSGDSFFCGYFWEYSAGAGGVAR